MLLWLFELHNSFWVDAARSLGLASSSKLVPFWCGFGGARWKAIREQLLCMCALILLKGWIYGWGEKTDNPDMAFACMAVTGISEFHVLIFFSSLGSEHNLTPSYTNSEELLSLYMPLLLCQDPSTAINTDSVVNWHSFWGVGWGRKLWIPFKGTGWNPWRGILCDCCFDPNCWSLPSRHLRPWPCFLCAQSRAVL